MSKKSDFISPVSIDLGAKNTGVYFAHYPADCSLDSSDFKKSGKVYQLGKDKYTLLMAGRTAARHRRRGYDRRQMVKRLFKLIWEKHLKLPWDKDTQQTISFLLNRRGFTFLTEEYDSEILSRVPQEVYDFLPPELKTNDVIKNANGYDFSNALEQWIQAGKDILKEKLAAVTKEPQPLKSGNLKNSIWNFNPENFDMDKGHFDCPDENENNNTKKNKKSKKQSSDSTVYLKTHLHHLAYAIYKSHKELESGGRHRSKYFEEVKNVLRENKHTHGYLKRFLKKLHTGELNLKNYIKTDTKKERQSIDNYQVEVIALTRLICHLSNFELKPLRKYFNDKRHKKTDYWDENKLTKIFENWILKQWRVDFEKDKNKTQGKRGDYQKLRNCWQQALPITVFSKKRVNGKEKHLGKLISFWFNTSPLLTIPPYQSNNNRRPPKCQGLIFNPNYLDNRYREWQNWLKDFKELPCIKDYLSGYEDELKNLKSSGKWTLSNKTNTTKKADLSFVNSPIQPANHSSESGNPDGTNKTYSYFCNISDKNGNTKSKYQRATEYLQTRALQFILDRVKSTDPLKLNEIYSHTKKYRQFQSTKQEKEDAKEKLEKAVRDSKLPDTLKTKRNYENDSLFEEGTFLHFVCQYYRDRQKARDGRIFIPPRYRYIEGRGYEHTGQFDDKNQLLTYCNHKPRQKRYQILGDLAALLQVPAKKLREYIENHSATSDSYTRKNTKKQNQNQIEQKIDNWFDSTQGLKNKCQAAAREQKNRRGQLKSDIQRVYGLIYQKFDNKAVQNQEVKKFLKQESKIHEAQQLYTLCEGAKEQCHNLTKDLYDSSQQEKWEKELKDNPSRAVYLLAQINNIAFKERGGNANTCVVCSADNAQRMQITNDNGNQEQTAKAQRLPAISTRIIDGAMMRMARILGGAIAADKWESILPELQTGKKVCVPIITESNCFEFEPSREELVKKQRVIKKRRVFDKGKERKIFEDKIMRIKTSNKDKVCPYLYGKGKISGEGEIDHIIPRKSKWGILNDEANLIWASVKGNQHKTDKSVTLKDLSDAYKKSLFPGKNDNEIKNWIIKEIDAEGERFKFGPYRNFINLTSDQQKAFRHALFLVGEPIRTKVINAINNRTRSFVNGTQRYFAEVLANSLRKKLLAHNAKHKDKVIDEKNLTFDYFGVEALSNSRGDGVYDLRHSFEKIEHPLFKGHKKKHGKSQEPYSHLIDAQLAFCIAANAHKKEGSFKLNIPNDLQLYPFSTTTGEIYNTIFDRIKIPVDKSNSEDLSRRGLNPKDINFDHYQIFNSNHGGWHFLKLIEIKINGLSFYLKGFLELKLLKGCLKERDFETSIKRKYGHTNNEDFIPYAESEKNPKIIELYQIGRKKYHFGYTGVSNTCPKNIINNKNFQVILHQIDKTKVSEFLMSHFNTKSDTKQWTKEDCTILDHLFGLWYHTSKTKITSYEDVKSVLDSIRKFKIKGLFNVSLFTAWNALSKEYKKTSPDNFNEFLRGYFLKERKSDCHHSKVRKNFSLPVPSFGQGWFLIRRRVWNKKNGKNFIYQCLSESNKFAKFSKDANSYKEVLVSQYRQKSIFLFPSFNEKSEDLKLKISSLNHVIDANCWYTRGIPSDFKNILYKVENKMGQDSKRAFVKLTFNASPKFDKDFFKIIQHFSLRNISKTQYNKYITNNVQEIYDGYKNELQERREIAKEKEEKNNKNELKSEINSLNKDIKCYDDIKKLFDKINKNTLVFQTSKPFTK